jgi:hypothetical protein
MLPCWVHGQEVSGWILQAPPKSVELSSVSSSTSGKAFTFRNVSGKTIIEFLVQSPTGNMTGVDGFTLNSGSIPPGELLTAHFGDKEFVVKGNPDESLRVAAIVYGDGSHTGMANVLNMLEDQMLGAALETKRCSEALSESGDPSITGLESAVARINSNPLASPQDSMKEVQGVVLSDLPTDYIHDHIAVASYGLHSGVRSARDAIDAQIDNERKASEQEIPASVLQKHPDVKFPSKSTIASDLARQFEERAKAQSAVLRGFIKEG